MYDNEIDQQIQQKLSKSQDKEWIRIKLKAMVNFIKFHGFQIHDIWDQKKKFNLCEFSQQIQHKTGYKMNNSELTAVVALCDHQNLIRPNIFFSLGLWHQKSNYQQKTAKKSHKIRKSNINIPMNDQKKFTIKNKDLQNLKSQFYYKQQIQFNQEVKKTILQKKWNFILMAAKLNQWAQLEQVSNEQSKKQSSLIKYKVLNSADGVIIYRLQRGCQQLISETVFEKIYEKTSKKYNLKENSKTNLKGTVLMVLQENDKLNKNTLQSRLHERDQQLNFLLLKVIRLRSMMKYQQKILVDAHVNC